MGLNLGLFMLGLSVASVLGLSLLVTPCYSYEPTFDKEEEENISVYDKAAKAVVTINCLVDGQPSSGSGVLLDASGLIVTSSHVIGSATVVYVALEDGRKARGTVIGRAGNRTTNAQMGQVSSDLALIKIRLDGDIPYLRLADSSKIRVGQRLLAIGHPYGFERTLTTGIVSRLDVKRDRIQTDAAINPGNSGGPVLDTKGYVLGINQAIYNPENSRSNIGIGFAVPANTVKAFMRDLAHMEGVPPTVASISQKPLIRYRPESDETGYEKVSLILERLANQP
ncbi:MAG: trypsin-like peptidase domain-containing protein [Vampirovibrionales bacterium]|nr:trypsin-like peptidase domain-containing protein [Vampirovibrionales bacterium]